MLMPLFRFLERTKNRPKPTLVHLRTSAVRASHTPTADEVTSIELA